MRLAWVPWPGVSLSASHTHAPQPPVLVGNEGVRGRPHTSYGVLASQGLRSLKAHQAVMTCPAWQLNPSACAQKTGRKTSFWQEVGWLNPPSWAQTHNKHVSKGISADGAASLKSNSTPALRPNARTAWPAEVGVRAFRIFQAQ